MFEIRIHGRGGQGAVTASELLAVAAFEDGNYSQAFPKFGPERTGAPVEAFCRISDKPIQLRMHSYEPDYVIVMDETLVGTVNVLAGTKENGLVLLNSKKDASLGRKTYEVDATGIALEAMGKNIVSATMLGAFSRASGIVSLDSIVNAIRGKFPEEIARRNVDAARRAFDECRCIAECSR